MLAAPLYFSLTTLIILTLTAIFTALLTIKASKGGLHDARRKWWKSITKRGWEVSGYILAILFLSICQNLVMDYKEDYRDSIQASEDSIRTDKTINQIQNGVDSSSRKIFSNLSEALAKQGLKFDTLNQSVTDITKVMTDSVINAAQSQLNQIKNLRQEFIKESKRKLKDITEQLFYDMGSVTKIYRYIAGGFLGSSGEKYMECKKELTPYMKIITENSSNAFLQTNKEAMDHWNKIKLAVSNIANYPYDSPDEETRTQHSQAIGFILQNSFPKLIELLKEN